MNDVKLLMWRPLRFTWGDASTAFDEWGCNCGPSAIAAMCDMSLAEVRPHLLDFESKRYTNPSLMAQILGKIPGVQVEEFLRLNPAFEMQRTGRKPWPKWGLARIQWEGPWTKPGVPVKARYRHTHWVGVNATDPDDIGIWDVNALVNESGWTSLSNWEKIVVPWVLEACVPKADGRYHLTHAVELALP